MRKLAKNLTEIVSILNDCKYNDGDTIGKQLGITRSAVWKAIKKLDGYGIKIDSIKGKGYALTEPLILFNADKIDLDGVELEIFETIESTNDYIKNLPDIKQSRICVAEHQSKARGRFDRNWASPFGQNIYVSFLYHFEKDISELAGLALVVGLAILETLKEVKLPSSPMLKWPNDIIYNNQKLAGSLIEIRAETNGLSHAIIGIGLNVNMMHDTKEHVITQAWTSLRKITGDNYDRNKLLRSLTKHLFTYIERFNREGFSSFIKELEKVDSLYGKQVSVINSKETVTGIGRGINNQGNLLLELANKQIRAFSSGDTSLLRLPKQD